jgi:hypothetical protein
VTELEQQFSQLKAAIAQQTQDQVECALNQQQQARICELEAERAVTAQRVEAQIQSALSKQQHQQQKPIVQLVQKQIQLHTEQRQTVERENKLQKLQKRLDRYQSSTNK